MVPTERTVLQFFISIICTINGLHSYPRNHPSLGILNELIGTDSKSPLIVVVDSNNQAKTLDDETDREYGQGQGQSHSKSCPNHPDNVHSPSYHNHDNSSPKMSEQNYQAALYELLRTSQKMMEKQARQGSCNLKQNGGNKNSCEVDTGKIEVTTKNSCDTTVSTVPAKQQFWAEQWSQSVDSSCGNFEETDTC